MHLRARTKVIIMAILIGMSKSIAYDGKRMSWCDGFETLQDFIKVALGFEGKWRSYGGSH